MKKHLLWDLLIIIFCIGGFILVTKLNNRELTISELWGELQGIWTDKNYEEFVSFSFHDGKQTFNEGIWNAGGGRSAGVVKKMEYLDNNIYKVTIFFAKEDGNELDGPYEELTIDIKIDVSDIKDKRITVSGYEKNAYTFSGNTLEEAYNKIKQERGW